MATKQRIWDLGLITEASALRAISLRFESLRDCPSYKRFVRRPTRQWLIDNLPGQVCSGGYLLCPEAYIDEEVRKYLTCSFCRKPSDMLVNLNECIFWACPRCLEVQFDKRSAWEEEKKCQGASKVYSPDTANYGRLSLAADI